MTASGQAERQKQSRRTLNERDAGAVHQKNALCNATTFQLFFCGQQLSLHVA